MCERESLCCALGSRPPKFSERTRCKAAACSGLQLTILACSCKHLTSARPAAALCPDFMRLNWRLELLLLRLRGCTFSLASSSSLAPARGLHTMFDFITYIRFEVGARETHQSNSARRPRLFAARWRRACALQGPGSTAARRLGAVADGREHGKRRAGPRACHVPRSIGALLPRLYSNKRDTAADAVTVTVSIAASACAHGARRGRAGPAQSCRKRGGQARAQGEGRC